MNKAAIAILLLFTAGSAQAAHCPLGQIWRVHLRECVSSKSALARAYVAPHAAVSTTPRKDYVVEIVAVPKDMTIPLPALEPPPHSQEVDHRSPDEIQESDEHDAAMAAHKDELMQDPLLRDLKIKEALRQELH